MTQTNDLVLITGATGNIGTLVCQNLVNDPATFKAGYGGDITSDLEKILGRSPISFDQFVADRKTKLIEFDRKLAT